MYERFTDRARKVLQLANQEAQHFGHEFVGTEHILLGLVMEGSGVAANVLKNLDIALRKIRQEIEKIIQSGPDRTTTGRRPQTPRAKKVIEYAIEAARNLGHNYVGTEHLLLGLLREEEAAAAQILMNLGLRLDAVRAEVLMVIGPMPSAAEMAPAPRSSSWRPAKEYDVYLPLRYPDGSPVEPEKIAGIAQRVRDQCGGLLRVSRRQDEAWRLGGAPHQGEVVILHGITAAGDVVRGFFERLKDDLKSELRQEEILILERDVRIL